MVDKLRKLEFKYLDYVFENMCSVKSKHYPDSTFFKKNDKVTLELEKSGTLWVLYSVWTSITDMFSLDYNETQQLIKVWMEEQLKLREVEPIQNASFIRMEVEEQIKPVKGVKAYPDCVEKQLKQEEVTPSVGKLYVSDLMEEELKSTEVTPLLTIWNYDEMIEEQLKPVEITPLQGCVSPFSMDGEELTPQRMDYVIIGGIEEGLEPVEITPRNAIAPPFRWRKLDSVKYAEIKTISNKFVEFRNAERRLNSEEVTPRQVVNGSFDWVQDQIKLEEVTPEESIPLQCWCDLRLKKDLEDKV